MNVKYDFTQTGGLPLDQNILNDLQKGTLLVDKALADLVGPLAVISGCVIAGTNAGNGVVAINGEILPFIGGAIQTKVIVLETTDNLTYFDGAARPSQITRYATFGDDGVQNNLWANFKRNHLMWLRYDVKEIDCTLEYFEANFDGTGLGINERVGWAFCNGQNGTKDRRGRTTVQYDPTKPYADTIAKIGGLHEVVLTTGQLPKHKHQLDNEGALGGPGTVGDSFGGGALGHGGYTSEVGNDEAHENMPPYMVTIFIQKL